MIALPAFFLTNFNCHNNEDISPINFQVLEI